MLDNPQEIDGCQEIDRFLRLHPVSEGPLADRNAWRRHREECASCAEQWAVELELQRHFGEVPSPVLGPDFDRMLQQRLVVEVSRPVSAARRASSLRRMLLPSYWLVAAVAGCWVLSHLDGSSPSTTWAALLVVGLVWLAFSYIAKLAHRRGLDVFDLVFLPTD